LHDRCIAAGERPAPVTLQLPVSAPDSPLDQVGISARCRTAGQGRRALEPCPGLRLIVAMRGRAGGLVRPHPDETSAGPDQRWPLLPRFIIRQDCNQGAFLRNRQTADGAPHIPIRLKRERPDHEGDVALRWRVGQGRA
jgi:hypothetical protein